MVVKIRTLVRFDVGCKKLLVAEVQVQLILVAGFGTVPIPWVH